MNGNESQSATEALHPDAAARPEQCLVPVEFDSRAFGFPFYRVTRLDEAELRRELEAFAGLSPMAVDAKAPAGDLAAQYALMRLGFRKVCMQVTMRHDLSYDSTNQGVDFSEKLNLDEETLWAHARNFTRDRFSQDPLLPKSGRHRLYYQWLRNSLGGRKLVAHVGSHLCTFSLAEGEAVIDLVSILEGRRGYGQRLISAVVDYARRHGAREVRVTTECENTGAWMLYQRAGFVAVKYSAVFHLVVLS